MDARASIREYAGDRMTAAFTVILPHRRNPGNDAALSICIDCLMKNTVNDFMLLIDAAVDQPLYPRVNAMFAQATTDCCVYMASDTFLAPGWDVPMLAAWNERTIVTNVLVEPGAIGLHALNLHRDFGRRPDTFRRAEFEAWAQSDYAPMLDGMGWYCPYMMSRAGFLEHGGLSTYVNGPDAHGFTGADESLFERWKAAGNTVLRVKSFAYHLQRYSQIDEQEASKRDEPTKAGRK